MQDSYSTFCRDRPVWANAAIASFRTCLPPFLDHDIDEPAGYVDHPFRLCCTDVFFNTFAHERQCRSDLMTPNVVRIKRRTRRVAPYAFRETDRKGKSDAPRKEDAIGHEVEHHLDRDRAL